MHTYYAIVHHEKGSAYGISFPDIPDCFAAADAEHDIATAAQEALALYFAETAELPKPRGFEVLKRDPEVKRDLRSGAFLMQVTLIVGAKKQRHNIMLERDVARGIAKAARASGSSKSDYIALAVKERLRRDLGAAVVHGEAPKKRETARRR